MWFRISIFYHQVTIDSCEQYLWECVNFLSIAITIPLSRSFCPILIQFVFFRKTLKVCRRTFFFANPGFFLRLAFCRNFQRISKLCVCASVLSIILCRSCECACAFCAVYKIHFWLAIIWKCIAAERFSYINEMCELCADVWVQVRASQPAKREKWASEWMKERMVSFSIHTQTHNQKAIHAFKPIHRRI